MKCRFCRKEIRWIVTEKGAKMPCDPTPVKYWQQEKASGKVVLQNGKVVSCVFEGNSEEATGMGYIPHFSTCKAYKKNKGAKK